MRALQRWKQQLDKGVPQASLAQQRFFTVTVPSDYIMRMPAVQRWKQQLKKGVSIWCVMTEHVTSRIMGVSHGSKSARCPAQEPHTPSSVGRQ
jgi:hypothetical protein